MKKKNQSSNNKKQGVAIIMVLGLLSVMMIAAMAFSISMRVERQGAASFRNSTQSRHMLYAALGRAMEDITEQMQTSDSFLMYPSSFEVLTSSGDGVFTNEETRARLLTRTALDFLPDDLADSVMSAPAYWHTIENADGTIIGRYAFVAADCSGWVDINYAGGTNARLRGVSPKEIRLGAFDGVADAVRLLDERDNYPFETFRELKTMGEHDGFLTPDVKDLFTFSLSPGGFLHNGTNRMPVYIGTNVSEWSEADITNAFRACETRSSFDTGLVYSNLLDYIDADSLPQSLADGHVDTAPMFNEAALAYVVELEEAGDFSARWRLDMECLFPFRYPGGSYPGTDYLVEYELSFADAGTTAGYTGLIPTNFPSGSEGAFQTVSRYNTLYETGGPKTGTIPTNNFTLHFTGELKVRIKEDVSDELVDEVPHPDYASAEGIKFEVKLENQSVSDRRIWVTNWVECLDPRFNGDPEGTDPPRQWRAGDDMPSTEPTIGTTNFYTQFYVDNADAYSADSDSDTSLYIANTNLRSVGELGYICLDKPWYTFRLYEHAGGRPAGWAAYHPVFDWFTMSEKEYEKGLINVNSFDRDVLAAAFKNAPISEYDPSDRLSQTDAEAIADEIVAKGPYTNLSELARIDWWTYASGDEIDKEGPLRNTGDLLTTRQNIFTIILAADSYAEPVGGLREGNYGSVRARSRAIAVVWRDPYPDEDGNHRYFLRYFDVLGE